MQAKSVDLGVLLFTYEMPNISIPAADQTVENYSGQVRLVCIAHGRHPESPAGVFPRGTGSDWAEPWTSTTTCCLDES